MKKLLKQVRDQKQLGNGNKFKMELKAHYMQNKN